MPRSHGRSLGCAALAIAALFGCSSGPDVEAGDTVAVAVAPDDSGMAGMDHSNMPGMNRTAPDDSNQVFLRMMSDHHQGFVLMADSAARRAQNPATKTDAQKLSAKQAAEQREMLAMLMRMHRDTIMPMVMATNQAMMDSTLRATGASIDPVFYRQVVNHHREGVTMTERLMPYLTGEIRQMAETMVAEQRREIEEFGRKATTVQ